MHDPHWLCPSGLLWRSCFWGASKCEYYQGGAWHHPLFRDVGLPHIYCLLCASLWQVVWCKNSHLSDLWFVLLQIASNRPPSPPVVLFPGCMMKPLGSEWGSDSAPVISREGGRGRSLTSPLGCLEAHSFYVLPPPAVIGSRGRVSDFSILVSKINASCWATCFLALLRHSCLIVFLPFGYEWFAKAEFSSWLQLSAELWPIRGWDPPTNVQAQMCTHGDGHVWLVQGSSGACKGTTDEFLHPAVWPRSQLLPPQLEWPCRCGWCWVMHLQCISCLRLEYVLLCIK